jgi:hypothetical protein
MTVDRHHKAFGGLSMEQTNVLVFVKFLIKMPEITMERLFGPRH